MAYDYDKFLRDDKLPHIWCPGCTYGTSMKSLLRALERVGWDKDNTVIISGIGCIGRITGYIDFNTIHALHGRALSFATGVKLSRPELNVVVIGGDGDISSIGGGHLMHTCRRNIDITILCFNNESYGMTGGQYSPTTTSGQKATTAPYGMSENNFDLIKLAQASGATFTARSTAYHFKQLEDFILKSFNHKGTSFVEIVSSCHTGYGKLNGMSEGTQYYQMMKESAVPKILFDKTGEVADGKFVTGIFSQEERPEYVEQYDKASGLVTQS